MSEPPFDKIAAQRWFAVELNNAAWDWLEAGDYDVSDFERLIHSAHASCYHWMQVGEPANHARAACLVANVYAAIGDGHNAIRHARRCLELTKANSETLADWDWAFAYDALARAHAAAGDIKQASLVRKQAQEFGGRIGDPEDKAFFDKWHCAGSWHSLRCEL
ncbi:MAG: hypothetical protein H6822_20845 [Planctomycetaceae bacterium]|nr:hypothetical protein [Planctomycetales bacterium]MCB9924640.1 hypothetical protein [Planctomycetaceae bacterium]